MNCDLVRRVRNINGITQHKLVLRNDIKMAAKLIQALDERGGLWSPKADEEGQAGEVREGDKRWAAWGPLWSSALQGLIHLPAAGWDTQFN